MKVKRLTLIGVLFIILSSPLLLFAVPVDLDIAENVAEFQLVVTQKINNYTISDITIFKNDDGDTLAYIANLEPSGFIVVTPETDITPVLAYSFICDFPMDDNENNILYHLVKNDMKLRLQAISDTTFPKIQKNNDLWNKYISEDIDYFLDSDFQQWPGEGSTSTGGWIETTWNQSHPYNMFCPIDPDTGIRSVVGCVATAMAMIIDYHQYVGDVYFNSSDSYTTWNGIHIDGDSEELDFPNFEELNEYLDTLAVHYQNNIPLTDEDMAALNFACGISLQMGYSSSGSGALPQLVEGALLNKFGYDSALWIESSVPSFYDSLSTNMMDAKPAELSIIKVNGTGGHAINYDGYNTNTDHSILGWRNPHAIICDGYNTNDFYHLNFGWGATSPELINNAWYLLPEGMPAGYSVVEAAVLNIQGGERPLTVTGNVSANGEDPTGTIITLEGKYNYTGAVDNPDGFYEIPVVFPGYYTATAILNRVYYQTKEVYIDSLNTVINFNLFNYESVDGIVSTSDGTDPTGTLINFIGENNYSTTVDNPDGLYEIPDVLPGHYTAIASLNRTYYQRKEVDIDSTNMTVDFLLDNYSYSTDLHYYNIPYHIFEMPYEYSLEVSARFTPDELQDHTSSLISSVSFLPPTSPDSCNITIKIYEGGSPDNPPGNLVYESEITDFDMDNFVEHDLTIPIPIQPDLEYWVGYHITTDGKVAWLDEGPGIQAKGAWMKHTFWVDVSQNPNFNGNWMVGMTTASLSVSPDMPQDPLIKLELTNYPNPFSTSTTISFNTHSASWRTESAEIKIYNIKGQLIRQFNPPAGGLEFKINEAVWDGTDENGNEVSPGVYFYKLEYGDNAVARKMLKVE